MSGVDLGDLFGGVQSAVSDLFGQRPRQQQAAQPSYYEQYFQQVGGGLFGTPMPDVTYGASPAQQAGPNFGVTIGADPFGGAFGQWQLGSMDQALFAKQARETARAAASGPPRSGTAVEAGSSTPGEGWGDPSAEQVEGLIAQKSAQNGKRSPLTGQGAYIVQTAKELGIPVAVAVGIFNHESQFGTDTGELNQYNNWAGLTGTGWAGQTGTTSGMARPFATFATPQAGIRAAMQNMASADYRNLTVRQFVAKWLTGDPSGASDPEGYTVNDYVSSMQQTAQALGIPFNPDAVVTRPGGTGGRAVADAESVFPVQGWTGDIHTHWDSDERGATDLFAAQGTPVLALTNGQVTYAGYDPTGGYNVMIRSDDGTDEYYAHLWQRPMVTAGQRVSAGQQLGGVGNTGNAATVPGYHLHLGKGFGIISGAGAHGGAGRDFDLVGYLQARQQRARGVQAAPQQRGRPS